MNELSVGTELFGWAVTPTEGPTVVSHGKITDITGNVVRTDVDPEMGILVATAKLDMCTSKEAAYKALAEFLHLRIREIAEMLPGISVNDTFPKDSV